jgi:GntR family transcriptional regulator, transcriptional repressor for pyruvate dehydrogenase complex
MQDAMSSFTPVRNVRLSEEIIRQIAALIADGSLKLNDKFPSERELQERWQVSRPVLREAFRVLEMQGVVESRQGAGRYLRSDHVPEPFRQRRSRLQASPQILLQLWHAREGLESKAAALAATTATRQQIAEISRTIKALRKITLKEFQRSNLNRDFHMNVAAASNNPFLQEMIAALITRSSAAGFKEAMDEKSWAELEGRHERIYSAIANGDPNAAQKAVVDHFKAMRRTIGED